MRLTAIALSLVVFAAPVVADATPDGAAIFKSKCAMCHGPDGSGKTAIGKSMNLRPLGSAAVQKQTDAQLAAIVADGKGKMPGYKGKLSGDEIKQLVAHIRTFKK
jgi:cytochrome c6